MKRNDEMDFGNLECIYNLHLDVDFRLGWNLAPSGC